MDKVRDQLVATTSKLISFKTISGDAPKIDECLAYIYEYFDGSGLYRQYFTQNGVRSLLVSNSNSKTPDLLLNGHIDVVEGLSGQFNPRLTGNKLYGRGAIDMKGSIAVMMQLMKQVKTSNTVAALFVSDEEIHGENGTKYVLSKGLRPKFTIITEESDFAISVGQKGDFILKLTAFGKKAHTAWPKDGDNAIDKVISIYQEFRRTLRSKRSFAPTLNLATISGGVGVQFVPDFAEAMVDIRVTNKGEYQAVIDMIERVNARKDCKVEALSTISFMEAGDCQDEIKQLKAATSAIIGGVPKIVRTPYGSDGRFLTERGLPVVEFGPTGAGFHGDEEYVDIDRLVQYYRTLEKFIGGLE